MIGPVQNVAELMPDTATVRHRTQSQDNEGTVTETDGAVVVSNVAAQFSPLGGDTEVRNASGDFVVADALCYILGDYDISETDVCVMRGETFDVIAVQRWSGGNVTGMHLQRRSP